MEAIAQDFYMKESLHPNRATIHVTLYELIEAINEEVDQGEDWLVTEVILDLFNNKQIRFMGAEEGLGKKFENVKENSYSFKRRDQA